MKLHLACTVKTIYLEAGIFEIGFNLCGGVKFYITCF